MLRGTGVVSLQDKVRMRGGRSAAQRSAAMPAGRHLSATRLNGRPCLPPMAPMACAPALLRRPPHPPHPPTLLQDGRVIEAPIGPNSTFTVLPNARHAVRAEGPDDLHAVVAIDHPPFRAVIFKSWEDREDAGHEVFPIFWDQACPKAVPASLAHLVVHGGGGGGGTAEL